MARGLDHIIHAVRDLDAAAELYRRLGFTVGARNRHPRAPIITSCSFRLPWN
jgi:catechol 2,3-dioxygenase-like lactoylglutathione lyase family enzyme